MLNSPLTTKNVYGTSSPPALTGPLFLLLINFLLLCLIELSADKITSIMVGQAVDAVDREKGKYTLIRDVEDFQTGAYDKPLPCFGCGIGWFS